MRRKSQWSLRNVLHYLLQVPGFILLALYTLALITGSVAYFELKPHPQSLAAVNPITLSATAGQPADFYNWSGYAATGMDFHEVTAKFLVPRVDCLKPNAQSLFWVGFDGFTAGANRTVEQIGIAAVCGVTPEVTPTYEAFWEMYPTNAVQYVPLTRFAVVPGNQVTTAISYTHEGNFELQLRNHTNGQSFTTTQSCGSGLTCARSSAEWIAERPTTSSGYSPLGNWGQLTFDQVQAADQTGQQHSLASLTYEPVAMVNSDGEQLAMASELDGSTGASFTDTWLAAQ